MKVKTLTLTKTTKKMPQVIVVDYACGIFN